MKELESNYERVGDSSPSDRRQCAKDKVESLSQMLAEEENTEATARFDSWRDIVNSKSLKIAAVTAGAAGLMGLAGLMKKEEMKESIPPPVKTTPVVEIAEVVEQQPIVEDEGAEVSLEKPTEAKPPSVEADEASWWHDTPTLNQKKLTYRDQENDYGCVPTAVSMVTEYWHQQDQIHKTISAQELLDINAAEGDFHATGMSITKTHDELASLGYKAVDYMDADLETLKHEVEKGPVVALVKLGMSADGEPHSVVVTGVSENNEVRVNDPWTGEARTYRWETFSRSWGSRFKGVSSRNHFTVIKPSQALERG